MLAQSSSAEVFYDKIRHELRVTSVHQCDSLKSLGRILGAVTVAFLEEAPKYYNDDCSDEDEVQSSDQVSQCQLDRSKVWEDIPASLSLIPMPGTSSSYISSQQLHRPSSQARNQVPGGAPFAGKVRKESDCVSRPVDREAEGVCEATKEGKRAPSQLKTREKDEKVLVTSDKDIPDETSSGSVSAHRSLATSSPRQFKFTEPKITAAENFEEQPDSDQNKLSSPSVSNSIDSFWRQDTGTVKRSLISELELSMSVERNISQFGDRDTSVGLLSERHEQSCEESDLKGRYRVQIYEKQGSDRNGQSVPFGSRKVSENLVREQLLPTSSRKDIENVVVKEEVFHGLCHSSAETEGDGNTSFSRFDEEDHHGDTTVDMADEEYLDNEDNDSFVKGSDSGLATSRYLFGESGSAFLNPYSANLGETAFPGCASVDPSPSVSVSERPSSGFPFTLPISVFGSHVRQRDTSSTITSSTSIPKSCTSLLPHYPSSSSLLHLKGHIKKSHKKIPTCAVCYAEIRDKNDFAAHASLHSLDDQHNCPVCLKIFSNRANLLRHSALHILGVLYQCPICCKMIKRGDNFQVHMRKQHPGQSVKVAKIVSGLRQDSPSKTVHTSTRTVSTGDRFHWFGKSSSLVKLEPQVSSRKTLYSPDGDGHSGSSGSRARSLLADSSSERDSLDLSLHPRPCPYCINTFTSSFALAQHIEDMHGEFSSGRITDEN